MFAENSAIGTFNFTLQNPILPNPYFIYGSSFFFCVCVLSNMKSLGESTGILDIIDGFTWFFICYAGLYSVDHNKIWSYAEEFFF